MHYWQTPHAFLSLRPMGSPRVTAGCFLATGPPPCIVASSSGLSKRSLQPHMVAIMLSFSHAWLCFICYACSHSLVSTLSSASDEESCIEKPIYSLSVHTSWGLLSHEKSLLKLTSVVATLWHWHPTIFRAWPMLFLLDLWSSKGHS